jgi:hypothetical protein
MRELHATDARGDGAAVGLRRRTAPASRGAERANQRGGQRREEDSEDKDSDEESRACEQKIGETQDFISHRGDGNVRLIREFIFLKKNC